MGLRRESTLTLEEVGRFIEEIESQRNPNKPNGTDSLTDTLNKGSKKMAALGCNNFYKKSRERPYAQ